MIQVLRYLELLVYHSSIHSFIQEHTLVPSYAVTVCLTIGLFPILCFYCEVMWCEGVIITLDIVDTTNASIFSKSGI